MPILDQFSKILTASSVCKIDVWHLSCWPDPSQREVCCLPGARVRDVARELPGLVPPSDYYLLLVMQVGRYEIGEKNPKAIKRDFRALGQLVEGLGHRQCFLQSHQWQGQTLGGTRKLTWWTGGSETGAVGGIFIALIMGKFTRHQACWWEMESGCLKGEKGFLATSWWGSLRGL